MSELTKVDRCPTCGYTQEDAKYWGDHARCKNAGNAPWEKSSPVPEGPAQSSETASATMPTFSEEEPRRARKSVYNFVRLPYHTQLGILEKVGLMEPKIADCADMGLFAECFRRARERRVMDKLLVEIAKHDAVTQREPERCDCLVSTGICGRITRGKGKLDFNGYWEIECPHGRAFEDGPPTQPSPVVQTPDVLRCQRSGNPCGTDTEMAGTVCLCESCIAWRALALKPEIAAPVVPVEETKREHILQWIWEDAGHMKGEMPIEWGMYHVFEQSAFQLAETIERYMAATEKEK